MPSHKVKISISRDHRPWWRTWNDYPNPTRDALLALLGIVVIGMVSWLLSKPPMILTKSRRRITTPTAQNELSYRLK